MKIIILPEHHVIAVEVFYLAWILKHSGERERERECKLKYAINYKPNNNN